MQEARRDGWRTFLGDTLLGTAYFHTSDQPFYICSFEPTAAFDTHRPIFDEYATLVNNPSAATVQMDSDEFYEANIASLDLRPEPFGNVLDTGYTEIYVAQIYDAQEAWLQPI